MKAILDFLVGPLNNIAWLYIFLPCVAIGGLFLTIRTGGMQFTHFGYAMRNTVGKMFRKSEAGHGAVTPLQAVTTALAATVGTGNIVGTSQAIALGGYGAVFWLWIAALLGMVIKYSEVTLSIRYRERKGRSRTYGANVLENVRRIWETVGCPCTTYFVAELPRIVREYEECVALIKPKEDRDAMAPARTVNSRPITVTLVGASVLG